MRKLTYNFSWMHREKLKVWFSRERSMPPRRRMKKGRKMETRRSDVIDKVTSRPSRIPDVDARTDHPSTTVHDVVMVQETKHEELESAEITTSSLTVTSASYNLIEKQSVVEISRLSPISPSALKETISGSEDTDKPRPGTTTNVSQFIRRLSNDCFVRSEDITEIRASMEEVLEKMCDKLASKHQFFNGCRPILRGSMQEQTKISAPDEIDFMVCIANVTDFLTIDVEKVPRKVTKKRKGKDLTKDRVSKMIKDSLVESLPKFWCLPPVNDVYHSIHNSLARSYIVRRPDTKPVEDVSLDITLVTKLDNGYVVLSQDLTHSLRTFPEDEKQLTEQLRQGSQFIPCLKYAKYLAGHFFGHYEIEEKGYCVHKSYLPSYYLKTILFHMLGDEHCQDFEPYKTSSHDQDEEQFALLHGLFKRLAKALETRELPNYFFPDYDLIEMSDSFKPKLVRDKCERLLDLLEGIARNEDNSVSSLYNSLDTCEHAHFTQLSTQCVTRTRSQAAMSMQYKWP